MSKSDLVPKRIVNAAGVETTVYVRSDESANLENSQLRVIGAPTLSSSTKQYAPEVGDEITSHEELEALPAGAIVRGDQGDSYRIGKKKFVEGSAPGRTFAEGYALTVISLPQQSSL